MTSYENVYNRFLSKISDYDLPIMEEYDLDSTLNGWLIGAIAHFYKCKSDLSNRDDNSKSFNIDLSDDEIEILSILMISEWLNPQINSVLLTKQFVGGKEEKWFSQAQHLETLMALRDNSRSEAKKLMRDYTYVKNGYFE